MRKSAVALALSAAIVAVAAPPSQAVQPHDHDALPLLDARGRGAAPTGAATDAGRNDRLLSGRSKDLPREIVLDYVRDHRERFGLDDAGVAQLQLVARAVSPDGIVHLRFNQVLDGVLSFDRGIDGHVTADGRLITVSGAPLAGARLAASTPALGRSTGIEAATEALGPDATGEHAALRWTADGKGRARLAWQVTADDGDGLLYALLVDAADGELLRRQSLSHDLGQARWFRSDPLTTPAQTQITMPPAWYDDNAGGTRLWGQYVRTYTDRQNRNPAYGSENGAGLTQIPASDAGALDWLYAPVAFPAATPCPPGAPCTWDSTNSASADVNQFQAATNAHVLASRYHDHLLQAPIGFDEASGNFQVTNSSGQGRGGDPVRVEVNDGAGLNNANFGTPPDGQAPRMQMFLWTTRDVNGSDEADVVYHEYGHGLSSRLVVNASGSSTLSPLQSQMMGEAWSDFYAFDLLVGEGALTDTGAPAELALGSYVTNRGVLRAKPIDCPVAEAGVSGCDGNYAGRPVVLGGYTYGDLARTDNTSPHNGGEVWGETLWELRRAVGRQAALALVTGGMRLSPDAPSMLDMRDAILQQALAMRTAPGAADDWFPRAWAVFAARGFGASATTPNAASTAPTEAFDLPRGVVGGGALTVSDPYPGGDDDGVAEPGERVELSWPLASRGVVDLLGVTGTLTGAPALAILDGSAAWPLLGNARTAANSDPFVVRVPAGQCTTAYPVSLAISSTEGAATATATVDPRPGQRSVVAIPDSDGVGRSTVDAPMTVSGSGAVTDVDVRIDELRHTYVGDLTLELIHDGVTVTLIDRLGNGGYGGHDVIDAVIDSDAPGAVTLTPGGPIGGRFQPAVANALDNFDGHPVAGTWTLRIHDGAAGDTGELRSWGIDSPQQACGRLEIPAAATGAAAVGGDSSATLDGAVTPNGRATGLRFAWGTTSAYGATTPVEPLGAGDGAVTRAASLSGLAPSTTYHYRVEAIRDGALAVAGEDRTFTTAAAIVIPPPSDGGGGGGGGGPTPPGGQPPAGPPAGDTTAPSVTRPAVALARAARRGAAARRRATVRFTLGEAATVTALVTSRAAGITRGKACVAVPRKRPRGARACTRTLTAARATVRAAAGAVTLRLPGAGLPKGAYTLTLTAVDAAGNRSKPVTARVTVR
ncbi:M36 family metallopeptidase [Conexibacter sp. JD483]|uniref:M36 family metallopeptidase n=1 Tax=unclassified Conexibacter TaxID=2627773 RepID=UPI0027224C9C|nr:MULTISPECIES: M36 family metallopeptidase [unclassified Conexibacter]MDO8187848.1 M36 family metallopeptidase [Conexibacter sp. CPCC 205706]MDO8201200.1 M36 family metallopeptidase [Conexibacter sp. CPCC 205762]MDR9369788.1 M36 family metallopeptidase [Conexibacter sp. JD483]